MARREKASYTIQSVLHALDLLEEFSESAAEIGVTELSRRLKLHKNNVFRLLATLEMKGYIEQDRITENYRLGLKTLRLGQAYKEQMGLVKQARAAIEKLSKKLNETVYIGVVREQSVVYLDVVEANQILRVATRIGSRLPIHCSAIGKAQLAFKSESEIEKICRLDDLRRYTVNTIVDRDAFLEELKVIRQRGYATDNEEHDMGIKCVGAPIRDYTGQTVGGISVTGPYFRMTDERLNDEIIPLVLQAGVEISERLGFSKMG